MIGVVRLWRRIGPRVRLLTLASGFLAPPVIGLFLIERLFGGIGPGLWVLAGVFFLFAATLVIGLVRTDRDGSGHGSHR